MSLFIQSLYLYQWLSTFTILNVNQYEFFDLKDGKKTFSLNKLLLLIIVANYDIHVMNIKNLIRYTNIILKKNCPFSNPEC